MNRLTLVEVLVVVSVIAILVGVLLPALNKARAKARGIACISNQKQLGLQFAMYGQTNDDHFPVGGREFSWLPYLFMNSGTDGELNGEAERVKYRSCPVIKPMAGNGARYDTYGIKSALFQGPNVSCVWEKEYGNPGNCYTGTAGTAEGKFIVSRKVRQPGRYFYLGDSVRTSTMEAAYQLPDWGGGTKRIYLVHSSRANLLYVDGHVASSGTELGGLLRQKVSSGFGLALMSESGAFF